MERGRPMDEKTFRIIIIDDNPAIHLDFIKILKKTTPSELEALRAEMFGNKKEKDYLPQFEIDVASQGQEGVMRIEEALHEKRPYSLAFVDIRMPPGWDGIETIKHIWALDKSIQIVICTAYSDYSWEETVEHLGKTDNLLILKKPFDNISVRQLACALTKKWQLSKDARKYTLMLKKEVEDRTLSLQNSLSLIKSTFESSSDGILVISNEKSIVDYNQKFIEMLEIPESVITTKSETKVVEYLKSQLINAEEFLEKLTKYHNKSDEISIDIIKFKNGKIFECYSQPHKLNEKIVGRILDFRDITQRAKLEEELEHQATHDPLTGLANRVKLLERMRQAIKLSTQHQTQFAVLFLDFDRFKLINDSLSHIVGDQLLRAAADRLKSVIDEEDTLARLGGDEFIILFRDILNDEHAAKKVLNLLDIFQKPFNLFDRTIIITASVGISIYPKDGTSADILLRNADTAMYRAKAQKGNNFKFYTPELSMKSLAALDQEIELRHAIEHNEFFLCYQPELDLEKEKLVAVEALIRWQHPQKGIVLPLDFIPLAEETGLIVPIGDWVMRTACRQNKAWQDTGLPPIRVAVNVTSQQLSQENFLSRVKEILDETKLDPKYLEIELTENVILSNREIIRIVSELKKIGVIIAVDDFGTGYSSLSYLHKIPLDRLKIDSTFVQQITSANDDKAIICAMISMAKNLNLEVLAEGVETADQFNFLKKNHCGDIQGFYYSVPLLAEDLEYYLKNPEKIKSIKELTQG
jgi:diguanylate cyclase (GGDEF)-like protein